MSSVPRASQVFLVVGVLFLASVSYPALIEVQVTTTYRGEFKEH